MLSARMYIYVQGSNQGAAAASYGSCAPKEREHEAQVDCVAVTEEDDWPAGRAESNVCSDNLAALSPCLKERDLCIRDLQKPPARKACATECLPDISDCQQQARAMAYGITGWMYLSPVLSACCLTV